MVVLKHPQTLASVSLHQHQPQRQSTIAALFVLGYSVAAYSAYTTAGLPLAAALAEQVRLEALANSSNATAGNPADGVSSSAPPTIAPAKGTRDDLQSAEFDWDDEQVARKRHSRGPSPGDPRDPAPVPPWPAALPGISGAAPGAGGGRRAGRVARAR